MVLKKENVEETLGLFTAAFSNEAAQKEIPLEKLFEQGYLTDPFPKEVFSMMENDTKYSKKIALAKCSRNNNLLLFRDCIYEPSYKLLYLELIRSHHDASAAGHSGRVKIFKLLSRGLYWPTMRNDVERYIKNCHTCQQI